MGTPGYGARFSHFSYANPRAPKGGQLNLSTGKRIEIVNVFSALGVDGNHEHYLFAHLMKVPRDDITIAYPYVARAVEVDPKKMFVVFYLNPNAVFHDQTPIVSDDVQFTFELLKKEGAPRFLQLFENVKQVTTKGRHQVIFRFKKADDDLPFYLAQIPVLSKSSLAGKDFKKTARRAQLLGSGPYRIHSFDRKKWILFERVKDWWAADIPSQKGFYNFDRIKVNHFTDTRVAFEGFKKGVIDWWKDERISNWYNGYNFSAVKKGEVKREKYKKPFYHGLTGLFINTRRSHLKNVHVRQALNLLFNFDWMNRSLFFGQYERNQSIHMNSGFGARYPMSQAERQVCREVGVDPALVEHAPQFSFEGTGEGLSAPQKQKITDLFRKGGWVFDKGKLRHQKTKKIMHLDILVFAPGHRRIFRNYISVLRRFGIEAELKGFDLTDYMTFLRKCDYDLALHFHPHVSIPGKEQEIFWSSQWVDKPGTLNLSGVSLPSVDLLTEKIKQCRDHKKLKLYTSLLDRLIGVGYYIIPGWAPSENRVAYWSKINMMDMPASLYETDTCWLRKLEKRNR